MSSNRDRNVMRLHPLLDKVDPQSHSAGSVRPFSRLARGPIRSGCRSNSFPLVQRQFKRLRNIVVLLFDPGHFDLDTSIAGGNPVPNELVKLADLNGDRLLDLVKLTVFGRASGSYPIVINISLLITVEEAPVSSARRAPYSPSGPKRRTTKIISPC